ncbi:MAG: hypothetical protein AMXMBFR13_12080 [Phycisphaerae bacterium]
MPLLCQQWLYTTTCGSIRTMERLPRKMRRAWENPGDAHFLTYSCVHRWALLSKDRSRRWVIESLDRTRREMNLALWAYVIMPEQVHVVFQPRDGARHMRHILAALKRSVSQQARAYLVETKQEGWIDRLTVQYPSRTVFRFWQPGGGYDENIFRVKTLYEVIEYIHLNPARRGLVRLPTEWRWSSAGFWAGEEDVPLRMDPVDV